MLEFALLIVSIPTALLLVAATILVALKAVQINRTSGEYAAVFTAARLALVRLSQLQKNMAEYYRAQVDRLATVSSMEEEIHAWNKAEHKAKEIPTTSSPVSSEELSRIKAANDLRALRHSLQEQHEAGVLPEYLYQHYMQQIDNDAEALGVE